MPLDELAQRRQAEEKQRLADMHARASAPRAPATQVTPTTGGGQLIRTDTDASGMLKKKAQARPQSEFSLNPRTKSGTTSFSDQ